jgi:hypothetical protein
MPRKDVLTSLLERDREKIAAIRKEQADPETFIREERVRACTPFLEKLPEEQKLATRQAFTALGKVIEEVTKGQLYGLTILEAKNMVGFYDYPGERNLHETTYDTDIPRTSTLLENQGVKNALPLVNTFFHSYLTMLTLQCLQADTLTAYTRRPTAPVTPGRQRFSEEPHPFITLKPSQRRSI